MSASESALGADTSEALFEDAPCGYLTTDGHGVIVRVNRTFESLTGLDRGELIGRRRFAELLAPGAQIYYETHLVPLLALEGGIREVAVDVVRADGTRLPALINSVVDRDEAGIPRTVRTTVFDASDRRRYEVELLRAGQRDQEIALRLQRSLLDGELPSDERIELGVAYRPADDGLTVGGDWYDAFLLDDDSVCVVVGDVVGRGLEAASAMGQLRSAIRALALTGLEPGPLLDALDAYTVRHRVGEVATVAVAFVGLADGRLRMACAGHLPPALKAPGAPAELLIGGRSAPLAAYAQPVSRAQDELVLPIGGQLVIYTDGLVERVERGLDDGMTRLLGQLDARAGDHVSAEQTADALTDTMLEAQSSHDDVCVLVLRRLGA